jgi:hypothetical protein
LQAEGVVAQTGRLVVVALAVSELLLVLQFLLVLQSQ